MNINKTIKYEREFFYNVKKQSILNSNKLEILSIILNKCKEHFKPIDSAPKSDKKNSWRKSKPSLIPKDISDSDKNKNMITCLLNKLAPNNFENISSKLGVLIDSEKCLLGHFIDELFNKAVFQPVYCPYYVKLLLILSEKKYDLDNIISDKCEQFTNIININNCNLEKNESYDEFCKKTKNKQFKIGYSQFIGELFNKNLIVTEIIDILIADLIENILYIYNNESNKDIIENNIVSLTKIITTTYKKYPDIIDIYMDKYSEIYNLDLSAKLKFKILDIIELKK